MNKIEELLKQIDKEKNEEAIKLYKLGILNGAILLSNNILDFLSQYDLATKDNENIDFDLSSHLKLIANSIASTTKKIKDNYDADKFGI